MHGSDYTQEEAGIVNDDPCSTKTFLFCFVLRGVLLKRWLVSLYADKLQEVCLSAKSNRTN